MMLKVFVVDGEVKAMLRGIAERGKDLTPAMRVIGETIRTSVIRNFQAGGRPTAWKPLAESTILGGFKKSDFNKSGTRLLKRGNTRLRGGKPLTNTAHFRNSITARAYSDRAEIGTNVVYAAIHQFGGMAGRGRKVAIPARPFLMIQDEDWKMIREQLMAHWVPGWK
jgi:phage virion morphogenesis protein